VHKSLETGGIEKERRRERERGRRRRGPGSALPPCCFLLAHHYRYVKMGWGTQPRHERKRIMGGGKMGRRGCGAWGMRPNTDGPEPK